uniref:Selenoprotein F n=1 Tax=Elaeophora elaphi TaxID=1147741 RepID=A0A0R3S4Z0_9BILA
MCETANFHSIDILLERDRDCCVGVFVAPDDFDDSHGDFGVAKAIVTVRFVYSELNRQTCQERGFNSDSLQCSSCADLPKFHLNELLADCNSCCRKDYMETKQEVRKFHLKYPLAHIEICECNLGRFPQAEAFVKSNMVKKWGTCVKVHHVRGTLPTIKLLDEQGEVQKIMNIEKWDTDTITEFLNTWLEC